MIQWDFEGYECGVSTEHSRRSLQQYWMIRDGVIDSSLSIEDVFSKFDFPTNFQNISALQWAQMVICVQNLRGYSLVNQVDLDSFTQRILLEQVHVPIMKQSNSDVILTYWVYDTYRGRPTFYKHTLKTDGKQYMHTSDKGLSFPRKK